MIRHKQDGYTLMEVLIATLLLGIAVLALQKGIVLAQNARISAGELRTAKTLYHKKMLELCTNSTARSQHEGTFTALPVNNASTNGSDTRNSFKDLSDWRWRATYTETDLSEVLRITLTISRNDGSTTKNILMEERLVWLP